MKRRLDPLPQLGYRRAALQIAGKLPIAHYAITETSGTKIKDLTGQGRHGTLKSSGHPALGQLGPFGYTGGALFDGSTDYIDISAIAPAFSWSQGSISALVKMSDADLTAATGRRWCYLQADANNRFILEKTGNSREFAFTSILGGTSRGIATTVLAGDADTYLYIGYTWDKATKDKQRCYIAGITSNEMGSLGVGTGTLASTTTLLGATNQSGANVFKGTLAEVTIWDVALTQYQMGELAHWQGGRRVIFLGDSRTVGGTNSAICYPRQMIAQSDAYRPANLGVGGYKASDMLTAFDTDVAPYCGGAIVVVWAGLNDVTGGASTATTYSTLKQIWAKARTAGAKVLVCTEIDSQGASANAVSWHTSARADLSTKIASDATLYDDMADLGADSRLLDATNATYFQSTDLIHLTTTGYGVVAGIIGPKVRAL